MVREIKIGIIGVGNCASALLQGIFKYKDTDDVSAPGIMNIEIGGYKIKHIKPVIAFDVDMRKVGKDLSEAIFSKPNCTYVFHRDVPHLGVPVLKGPVLDGFSPHMCNFPLEDTFVVDESEPVDVVREIEDSGAEILLNYLPVGSDKATKFYANAALKAGCAFINCIPSFIASDVRWAKKFEKARLPVVGDDIKSQVGATILHRTLTRLLSDRGVRIEKTYQLNFGGNTDFLNMLERSRLTHKKISKTEAVKSQIDGEIDNYMIHIGPSDYVPWLNDNKICYIYIEGRKFGDVPVKIECKLSVEDSPNSAGCVIDAIRCCKLAIDRGVGGPLTSISAYIMKHPPQQYPDFVAKKMVGEFIRGERER